MYVYSTIITSAICFHCSCVGSVPVGLWAQACRTKIERSGQLWGKRKQYCKLSNLQLNRICITHCLPPSHQGNRPNEGPSSLHPSTCMDGHPQSQHWQIQHCDFLKQTIVLILLFIFPLDTKLITALLLLIPQLIIQHCLS